MWFLNKRETRQFDSEIMEEILEGEGARDKALKREGHFSDIYRDDVEKEYHKRP